MNYKILFCADFLRAELHERETAQQTRQFLEALYAEALKRKCWKLLICVRASQPIFRVEQYGLSEIFPVLTRQPHRVALLSDSSEVRASHAYVELLARQKT